MSIFTKLITVVVINATSYIAREKVVPILSKKIKTKIQELKNDLEDDEKELEQVNVSEEPEIENSQKEIFIPKWDKEL